MWFLCLSINLGKTDIKHKISTYKIIDFDKWVIKEQNVYHLGFSQENKSWMDGSNRQRRLDLNLWCTTNKCVSMAHISMVSLSSWLNKRSCVFFYSYLAHPLHHRKPKLWVAPADESKNRNVKHIPIRFPASNDPTPRKISVVKCIHVCVKRNHTPNPNKSQYQQPKSQWKTAQHNTASIMWPDLVQ